VAAANGLGCHADSGAVGTPAGGTSQVLSVRPYLDANVKTSTRVLLQLLLCLPSILLATFIVVDICSLGEFRRMALYMRWQTVIVDVVTLFGWIIPAIALTASIFARPTDVLNKWRRIALFSGLTIGIACCVALGAGLAFDELRYVYLHGHRSGHDPRGIEDYVVASLLIGPSLVAVWNMQRLRRWRRCVDKSPNQPPLPTPASGTPAAGAPVAPPSRAAGR
jgi:hypothetical protein